MTKCSRFKVSSGATESWEKDSVNGKEGGPKIYWTPTPQVNLNLLLYFIVHIL